MLLRYSNFLKNDTILPFSFNGYFHFSLCSTNHPQFKMVHACDTCGVNHTRVGFLENWMGSELVKSKVIQKVEIACSSEHIRNRIGYLLWNELSLENNNVLLWFNRLCCYTILFSGKDHLHPSLYSHNYVGISDMEYLARQYVWWPKIDNDIENKNQEL